MGRPKKVIDAEQVRKLAAIDCSYEEIALIVGCDESTLTRRFAQVIKEGRAEGRSSLKRMQFALAQKGNATMLIWLGKIRLGQREVSENFNRNEHSFAPQLTPAQIAELIEKAVKK